MIAYVVRCENALVQFGWTRQQAEWSVLACPHIRVFARTQ